MPKTLAERKKEILRLLKENYELKEQLKALKVSDNLSQETQSNEIGN
jgi:hypothetical protein